LKARVIPIDIVYCDEHIGYTASSWIMEFADIMEQEYGVKPLVRMRRDCSIKVDPTIVMVGGGEVEGLPGDPGHLYEMLKRLLDRLTGRGEGW
jgi:hypothetical protein